MQSLIAFACLLAVASAGYLNNVAPVAVANGRVAYNAPLVNAPYPVPVAHAYAAPIAAPIAHAYAAPVAHAYAAPIAHAYAAPAIGLASEARLVDPIAIAAGAPLPTGDTVEVAAAKAAHFAAHAVAKSQAYAAPVAAVAPVAHAYAAHAYAAPLAHAYAAPVGLASEARLVDPVAIAAGAPLPTGDTLEVAAAKAAHAAAHHDAKATHFLAKGHLIAKRGLLGATSYAAPLAYSGYAAHAYAAPIVTPFAHTYARTHFIGKRSPGFLGATSYAAPLAYSSYAGPYAYSAYNGYGYGHLGAIYG